MRLMGTTGIRVSELALGTMVLGAWGNPDHDECERIIHRALDAGINLVDTADVYAFGESEEIVGRALQGRRDEVVLATKFHNAMTDDPNHRGNSRRWITRAVEDSLRRLQTDRIDLYQVHRPDPDTDLDETLARALGPRPRRQGPGRGDVDVPRRGPRRGAWWRGRDPGPRALPDRAAAVLDLRPPRGGRRAARPASASAWASSCGARCRAAG